MPPAVQDPRITLTKTRDSTLKAMVILGFFEGGSVTCPKCKKPDVPYPGKFKIHEDGGWKHFSSEACSGDAIEVLRQNGYRFRDALSALTGRTDVEIPDVPPPFVATHDIEVYQRLIDLANQVGGQKAAVDFYGQFFIDENVVKQSKATYITKPYEIQKELLRRFGKERLIASGLFIEGKSGPRMLPGKDFPIIEPHLDVWGRVWYMQFRAGPEQYRKYLEHKKGLRSYEQKFLSLRGARRETQIGVGLELLRTEPTKLVIVEGFKDALAARTMGVMSYGIPGVDFRPPDHICQLLKRHKVIVSLDGDEAGREHGPKLVEYLSKKGVESSLHLLPAGEDVTDRLVAKHKH